MTSSVGAPVSTYAAHFNWPADLATPSPMPVRGASLLDLSGASQRSTLDAAERASPERCRYQDKQTAAEIRAMLAKYPHLIHTLKPEEVPEGLTAQRCCQSAARLEPPLHRRKILGTRFWTQTRSAADSRLPAAHARTDPNTFDRVGFTRDRRDRTGSSAYCDFHTESALALMSNTKYHRTPRFYRGNPNKFK